MRVGALENKAPKKGMVGIEARRALGLTAGWRGEGAARIVVLLKA